MKNKSRFILPILALITFGMVTGAVSVEEASHPSFLADAGSDNYKLVGKISSLSLDSFTYANGVAMTNGGADNQAYYKNVLLTEGDVFKITDNTNWLGYANKDSSWIGDSKIYYAAQTNKIWEGENYYRKGISDDKACTGTWKTYGTDGYVDGGTGHITVRMKTPKYDYSGEYWTSSGASTWIFGTKDYQETKWSSDSAKIATEGNVQTWQFQFYLSDYTDFMFHRAGSSTSSWSDWTAYTNWFNCDTVFCSDKNFYVRETGYYDIYVNNGTKIYIEKALYTVNLDQNGGSEGTEVVYPHYDTEMPEATMPTKTGYDFSGYYDSSSQKYYNSDGSSAKNWDKNSGDTLYASWDAHSYSISYVWNGGSSTAYDEDADYDSTFSVVTPTRDGYTFAGWQVSTGSGYFGNSQATCTNPISSTSQKCGSLYLICYFKNLTATDNATVTLTATWNAKSYHLVGTSDHYSSITFYSDSGLSSVITNIAYDSTIYYRVAANPGYQDITNTTGVVLNTSNFTFANIGSGGTDATIDIGACPAGKYTISLDNTGATSTGTTAIYQKYATGYYLDLACSTQKMETSSNPITILPEKTDYRFGGFYTGENGTGVQYIDSNGFLTSDASNVHFTANGTLYVHWLKQYEPDFHVIGTDSISLQVSIDKTTAANFNTIVVDTPNPDMSGGTIPETFTSSTWSTDTYSVFVIVDVNAAQLQDFITIHYKNSGVELGETRTTVADILANKLAKDRADHPGTVASYSKTGKMAMAMINYGDMMQTAIGYKTGRPASAVLNSDEKTYLAGLMDNPNLIDDTKADGIQEISGCGSDKEKKDPDHISGVTYTIGTDSTLAFRLTFTYGEGDNPANISASVVGVDGAFTVAETCTLEWEIETDATQCRVIVKGVKINEIRDKFVLTITYEGNVIYQFTYAVTNHMHRIIEDERPAAENYKEVSKAMQLYYNVVMA